MRGLDAITSCAACGTCPDHPCLVDPIYWFGSCCAIAYAGEESASDSCAAHAGRRSILGLHASCPSVWSTESSHQERCWADLSRLLKRDRGWRGMAVRLVTKSCRVRWCRKHSDDV